MALAVAGNPYRDRQLKALKQALLACKNCASQSAWKMADGRNWTPNPRTWPPLRYISPNAPNKYAPGGEDLEAMLANMLAILDHPDFMGPTSGWDSAIEQARPEVLWEWVIMDRSAIFADLFSDHQRAKVAQAVAYSYAKLASA